MQANYRPYDIAASATRIRDIVNASDVDYTEVASLRSRDDLTFSNGFYANCSALFVDIRGSSQLPQQHRRPTLARLYRAYISEIVAVMNGDLNCQEVNVVGDGVWCVVKTPYTSDIDRVFATAYSINSMVQVLNYELTKRSINTIRVGIGMDWGRALMVKAGLAGSGINDVVYMGDVVNRAAKLASYGNQGLGDGTQMVGQDFYSSLAEENRQLLRWNAGRQCWTGDVISKPMEAWRQANCR